MQKIRIGLLGLGTVGGGVYLHLKRNQTLLQHRLGFKLEVTRVFARNRNKKRQVRIPDKLWAKSWQDVVKDPEVDVVVELIGGTTDAKQIVVEAMKNGKVVVIANKALLAKHGEELFDLSRTLQRPIFFEASVAGGIPIIKALHEGLVGNRILSMHGIVNGTCNYILTRMSDEGLAFDDVLKQAQDLGYAEVDPTLDVDGWDAAHKTAILASLAYGFWIKPEQVEVEGIRNITAQDIEYARQLGYRIKLLGIVKADNKNKVEIRVQPTLVPKEHVLSRVNGVYNAVAVRGDIVGETLFYGRGAGQDPTSSAVLSDLAEAGLMLEGIKKHRIFTPHKLYGKVKRNNEIVSRYYLRLSVLDQPGVLAQVATILGKNKVGISSVIQPESTEPGDSVPLVLLLHDSLEASFQRALRAISRLKSVKGKPRMIRIESFE
ncbi:MAG: homoserine dehydrogenase [Verrucomicrobiota bacterium]|nr:homoserine dehydrogenase [Verrucomicrobiota bacterium]